jgi:hypothetical protein
MPGSVRLGPSDGRVILRTYREGFAAQAGHDLVLELENWSAIATPPDAEGGPAIEAHLDLTSLRVLEGTGGVKPLSDKDKREITKTASKTLGTDHHPEAVFRSPGFTATDGGGTFDGTLDMHGVQRPLRVTVARTPEGGYRAQATIRQSEHGIKPYTGFFGALKVRDNVEAEARIDTRVESAGA